MALRPDSTPRFFPKGRDVHACGTVGTLNAFVLENPQLFERSLPYIQVRVLEQEGGGHRPHLFFNW